MIDKLLSSALEAKRNGEGVIYAGRPEEQMIGSSAMESYIYAKYVLEGPFPSGEGALSKNSAYSCRYAKDVIKGRWPPGEEAISNNPQYSYLYAKDVLKGPFPLGEKAIARSAEFSLYYIRDIIKGRWFPGEEIIIAESMLEGSFGTYFKDYRTYLFIVGELPPEWEELGIHDDMNLLRCLSAELQNYGTIAVQSKG